ncbi:Endonuclease/exonuclease/phosphatase [Zopfochytrium polystomum]|nr:Endonuclease/exonuclease/phosphatase [Zopfochytrium polystomum]
MFETLASSVPAITTSNPTGEAVSCDQLKIFIATWNLSGALPTDPRNLLSRASHHPDVVAIGTQEVCRSFNIPCAAFEANPWTHALLRALTPALHLVAARQVGTLHLAVFVRAGLIGNVQDVATGHTAIGRYRLLRNKGAVAIGFELFSASLVFVNSHLPAHQDQTDERNAGFHAICADLFLFPLSDKALRRKNAKAITVAEGFTTDPLPPKRRKKKIEQYKFIFWFGDLNYRVNGTRGMIDRLISQERLEIMIHNDQLQQEMKKGTVFSGFVEAPITFMPTYKLDRDRKRALRRKLHGKVEAAEDEESEGLRYDTSGKSRIPSWTDRILVKAAGSAVPLTASPASISFNLYDSGCAGTSDHRFVVADICVNLRMAATIAPGDNNDASSSPATSSSPTP